jgi:hypothetical protein
MRAADVDRDAVAERLRKAATEGRLSTEELERRMEAALSARTYGELDALVADLPGSRVLAPRPTRPVGLLGPALALAVAFPLAVASIVIAALVISGVLAMWWVWLAIGWWFFGRHRSRAYYMRYGSMHACGWHTRRVRAHNSRAFWV